jgi:hypothetical protein
MTTGPELHGRLRHLADGLVPGWLTCDSFLPVVTAHARCAPQPTDLVCSHRVPKPGLVRVADDFGAPILHDRGPIGRPGTARPMLAVS